jgi:hypothetical protein
MPRAKRAPGKRPRTWKDDWIVCPPPTRAELIRQMDAPLSEAIGLVEALRLMGHGLTELGRDEGCAILSVIDAAHDRLRVVQDAWLGLIQAAPRRPGRGRN